MYYFCELNREPIVSHLQELPRPSPPRTTRSWSRFTVLKAPSLTLFHLLRAAQRKSNSLPFYWRRKNAKSGLHTLCGYKVQNALPAASSPTRRFWPLAPAPGPVKKKKKPKCLRPSAAEPSREHLPFWNLLSLRPLCRVGTPGPFVGFSSWLRPPRLSHLIPPSSFSYLRSLLEHLGKARGLGDVKRHDQSARSRSRALSEDPGESERRAQPPGNVACGSLKLLLSLQPGPPLPPPAYSEPSREGAVRVARTELTILDLLYRWGGSIGLGLLSSADARLGYLADVARSRLFRSLRRIGSVVGTFDFVSFVLEFCHGFLE